MRSPKPLEILASGAFTSVVSHKAGEGITPLPVTSGPVILINLTLCLQILALLTTPFLQFSPTMYSVVFYSYMFPVTL